MAFSKDSMINRLSNLINRNRSAAKISLVLCTNLDTYIHLTTDHDDDGAITKWQWALLVSFLSNFGQNP